MHIPFVKKSTTVLIALVASLLGIFIAYAGFSGDTFGTALIRGTIGITRLPPPTIAPVRDPGFGSCSFQSGATIQGPDFIQESTATGYGATYNVTGVGSSGCTIYGFVINWSSSVPGSRPFANAIGDIYGGERSGEQFNYPLVIPAGQAAGSGNVTVSFSGCKNNYLINKEPCDAIQSAPVTKAVSWRPAAPTCSSHACSGSTPFLCFDANNGNVACQVANVPPFGGTCLACAPAPACPPAGFPRTSSQSCPGQCTAIPGQACGGKFYYSDKCMLNGQQVAPAQCPAVPATCGNGVAENPEECDDGNTVNTDACTNACKNARCGDGIKRPTEQCDDGNNNANDGCSPTCQIEPMGCNVQNQCAWNGTGASCSSIGASCQSCGNGVREGSEVCDGQQGPNGTLPADQKCNTTCSGILYGRCTGDNQGNASMCAYVTNPSTPGKACGGSDNCCTGTNRPNGCSCGGDARNCANNFCTSYGTCASGSCPAGANHNVPAGCTCTQDQQCQTGLSCVCAPGQSCIEGQAQARVCGIPSAPTPTPNGGPDSCGGQPRPNPNPCFTDLGYTLACSNNTWVCQSGG